MYFRVCPDCGAHLDPGELCDCRLEAKEEAALLYQERPQAKTPKASLSGQPLEVKGGGRRQSVYG